MSDAAAELLKVIDDALSAFQLDYRSHNGLLLREGDLQCALYNHLSRVPSLMESRMTKYPNLVAPRLHAEMRWAVQPRGKHVIPDLSIVDPENIQIGYEGEATVRFPSKTSSFKGHGVVFELKFAGHMLGIRDYEVGTVGQDVRKISDLIDLYEDAGHHDKISAYFVTASKVEYVSQAFRDFVNREKTNPRFRFVQLFGGLSPERNSANWRITTA